jgi:Ca2+-binding RTX toxin-like protein
VKLIRNGLVVVAVAAMMSLPLATAQAAEPTLVVTSLTGAGSQGWAIDEPTPVYTFATGPASIGQGSLQFRARTPAADLEKIYIKHELDIRARDYRSISFDYYMDSASAKLPEQYYLNVYVDVVSIPPNATTFYDCKYDVVGTNANPDRWHKVGLGRTEQTTLVTSKNGANCGDQISDLNVNDKIFRVAVNGGDTSGTDSQIKGAIDNVVVTTAGQASTVYDFEPAATSTTGDACPTGLNPVTGTARGETLDGTNRADKIDLKDGNDRTDARGGDDCILGGEGNDWITAGPGDDEVRAGRGNDTVNGDGGADRIFGADGNDIITPGAGRDTVEAGAGNDYIRANDGQVDSVDCGAGNDIVIADKNDTVNSNCETRPGS